jgi:putative tryptophan/tyrosine transport system substrate-binding protein
VDRRAFVSGSIALLAAPQVAGAQQTGKIPHIGVLFSGSSTETPATQREPFERGLRDLGWLPGSNIVIEYRFGDGSQERLETAAAEVARQGIDVFVARANGAVRAAQGASPTIPIVMSTVDDPVASGFVKSLARPGGRITGIANLVSQLDGKRLELLKETISGLTRVAVLANPAMSSVYERGVAHLGDNARNLGLDLRAFKVTRPDGIAGTFDAIDEAHVGALLVLADTFVLEPNRLQIVDNAAKHRLPTMYPWRFYTEIGGLMSYASDLPESHRRSAVYVDKILKGARPGDLPIEQPTKFELVINMKTAKALRLTIPPSLLLRADQVIE